MKKFKKTFFSSEMKKKSLIGDCFLVFWVVVVVTIVFWWVKNLAPANKNNLTQINFIIRKGEALSDIVAGLKEAGLIKSALHFKIYVFLTGTATKIQAGSFSLSPSMTTPQISQLLIKGKNDQWVTILEGLRQEQIAEQLIKSGFAINPEEWQRTVEAQGLEGKLFPDSYLLPKGATQEQILTIITRNFEKKVVLGLKDEIAASHLTLNEILTLASIVERESQTETDRQIVAGILLKRLQNHWPLQTDATIQYAVAEKRCKKTYDASCDWWPNTLTKADLAIQSAYNTYIHPQLPPTPICNPGLSAIKAVLNPQKTAYWYYLSDKNGVMHYAKTNEEQVANIQKYLKQ